MSFVRLSPCAISLAAALAVLSALAPAQAAKQPEPRIAGAARVAQGGRVDLAASNLTAADLAALRPEYARLKPRARTNAE